MCTCFVRSSSSSYLSNFGLGEVTPGEGHLSVTLEGVTASSAFGDRGFSF